MDPVTIIGAAASIPAVIDIIIKLSKKLRRYARTAKNDASEARDLDKRVMDFLDLLLLAESEIEGATAYTASTANFIRVKETHFSNVKALAQGLQTIIENHSYLLKYGSGKSIYKRWLLKHQWAQMKGRIGKLELELQTSRESLIIILSVAQMNLLQKEKNNLMAKACRDENTIIEIKAKM